MSTFKTALTAAIVAAIVASGTTYAATQINGRSIVKHSIPANRLTAKAVKSFTDPRTLAAAVTSTLTYNTTITEFTGWPMSGSATCPVGDIAIGGGYDMLNTSSVTGIMDNGLTADHTGWEVDGVSGAGNQQNENDPLPELQVYVSCVPA